MSTADPPIFTEADYQRAAQEYAERLMLTHCGEAIAQSTQRKITLESFDVIRTHRPDIHLYNELLVQYLRPGRRKLGQVVPDNMVVQSENPIDANGSYEVEKQPAPPFWVMEYVSKSSRRKDYEDNFDKYEQELRVPYYLLFYPETQDLQFYRHNGERFVSVPANEQGRHPIPELEIEVALLDGWVRYWFRGELVPLTPDLVNGLEAARQQLAEERQRAEQAEQRAQQAEQRAERAEQRAEQERQARLALERELEILRSRQQS